jgi:hypothetical protein
MLVLGSILGACQTTAGGATKVALCDQFRPIRWSQSDTAETIRQAKETNAVGVAVCGWKP